MKNIYENLYSDQKNSGNLGENLRIKIMLSLVDEMKLRGKNILDFGCHNGTFLSSLKNRQNNFYGLEANNWGVEKSREKKINVIKYLFDDAREFPYADNFFDVIIAGEIIEHIYDTDFFLEEIKRVLKPGGKIVVSTPNIASLSRRFLLLLGYDPLIEISPNETASVGHIRYFTRKTLEDLLQKHDFKILKKDSDCINFSKNGGIKSTILARIFPSLGASIIVLAEKTRK